MRKDKMQQTILNKLLDKYEKSKTFTGTNQVNQTFSKKVSEIFPKYNDDAEYDLFCDINEALKDLEKKELIVLSYKRGDIINRASLSVENLDECYGFVMREPKKDEHQWLIDTMDSFAGNTLLDNYFNMQKEKIAKNQKVEYFDGDKKEYEDLLKLVSSLLVNENEMFVRDLSIKLFRDSKRVEKLETKAKAMLLQYGDFLDKDSVFEECNVLKTPTYVSIKGKGLIVIGGQKIDLSLLKGDIALSTESLKELESVKVTGSRVVTVENLTSFHNYSCEEDFVIYLGGFHNRTKREFLIKLYEGNKELEYRHFGDIDAGGFYILEHLKKRTGIPFRSVNMDKNTLIKYIDHTKELTLNDRKRLETLLERYRKSGYMVEDYKEVIEYMLANGCKLEQEAVSTIT